jgi:hypothetical protein
MPTSDELISKSFRMFDEETDSKYEQDGDRTTALEYLMDGYFEICLETQCSQTSETITTISGTREYNLPSDHIATYKVYQPSEYRFLYPCYYNNENIAVNQQGCPGKYYLTPSKIGFNVIPDSAYEFTHEYFNGPTEELVLGDTPSLIPTIWQARVLPYYVLWKLFATDKREEVLARAPFWKSAYEEKRNKMKEYFTGNSRYAGDLPDME